MPNLGGIAKYLGLLTLGKGIIDKVVLQRLLVGVAGVVALSVIAAILVGTLIIGAFALIYNALITYTQVNEIGAIAIVGTAIAALTAFIVYKIVCYSKKISTAAAVLVNTSSPAASLASPVTDLFNSFIDGWKQGEAVRQQGKDQNFHKPVPLKRKK